MPAMTKSGWVPVVALALVSTILAGCLSEGELSLDGLAAPAWEPGFHWSYDVDATGTHTLITDGGRAAQSFEYATGLNSSVMNTSGEIDGQPVYFLVQDADMDDDYFGIAMGLFGGGGIVALTQDSLQPVARSSYWDWQSGCGPVTMYPVEEPSLLEFPLTLGKSWDGDMDHVSYTAEVLGVEPVETEAGTFDSVHVKITLVPEFEEPMVEEAPVESEPMEAGEPSPPMEYEEEESPEERMESAEYTQEYWYAPAVRNVVKTVTQSQSVFVEGDERYEMTASSTILLNDYSLVPGEEQPAPTLVRNDPWGFQQDSLRIITDTAFPYNVANGTTTARFGVEKVTPEMPEPLVISESSNGVVHRSVSMRAPQEGLTLVDSVPDVGDYDHEKYELVWRVYSSDGGHQEFVGDVLEFPIDGAEYINLHAELSPVYDETDDCGYRHLRWIMPAFGEALVFFEKAYTVGAEAGPAEEYDLGALPSGGGYLQLTGYWEFVSRAAGAEDKPYPVVYDAEGNEYWGEPDHQYMEAWLEPELADGWSLAWRVQGPDVLGASSPLATGHEAVLHIRIDPQ